MMMTRRQKTHLGIPFLAYFIMTLSSRFELPHLKDVTQPGHGSHTACTYVGMATNIILNSNLSVIGVASEQLT